MFQYWKMKEFIRIKGFKQKAIAQKAGIPETSLSMILQGKQKCPLDEYVNLCIVLGCSFSEFITKENNSENEAS